MEKKKKSILIGVTAIILITLTLLGLTYAYYRTRIIGNNSTEPSISVESEKLEIVYTNTNNIFNDGEIMPGSKITKTFSVENTGDGAVGYGIYLVDVINELTNSQDLKINLTCQETNKDGSTSECIGLSNYDYPKTNTRLVVNSINVGSKHNYVLEVEYLETVYDQTVDMGANIEGKIKIYAATDLVELVIDGTALADTDTLELHSEVKTATKVDGVYKFTGVEYGSHTLYVKDKDGNELGNTTLTITKGDTEELNGNTLTVANNTSKIEISIASVTNNVITLNNEVTSERYAIKVGDSYFTEDNLNEALLFSKESMKATLLKDINLTDSIAINTTNKEIYFDLNGYSLSCETCGDIIDVKGTNTNLNVSNGTINTINNQAGISIGVQTENAQNLNVTVEKDLTINSEKYGVAIYGSEAHLNFYGKINMSGDGFAISSNAHSYNPEINIYDGAEITAPNGYVLYLPHPGVTNIYGGTFSANTVIGIRSGTLNIDGGTFTATGEKGGMKTCVSESGIEKTGDVIYAKMSPNYLGNVNIDIVKQTTLTSTNSNALRVYYCENGSNYKITINSNLIQDYDSDVSIGYSYIYN